jgi:hypothetical protein
MKYTVQLNNSKESSCHKEKEHTERSEEGRLKRNETLKRKQYHISSTPIPRDQDIILVIRDVYRGGSPCSLSIHLPWFHLFKGEGDG